MKADSLIIERPERQKPLQRATFALITMAAWTFWVSLWLPVITLIAWLLGLSDAYRQLNVLHPLQGALSLSMLPVLACASALVFSMWSFYNRIRFGVNRRRRSHMSLDAAHMASALNARVETVEAMRVNRRSIVRFSDGGRMYLSASRSLSSS
jgi:biofilm PGA synthesis protein PgaD